MITLNFDRDKFDRLIRKLDALTRDKTLMDALNSGIAHLKAWIGPNRLSGRPGLIYRTGNLMRMIQPRAAKRIGDVIMASLNSGAIYSRVHEFGWPPGQLNARGVDMNIPARPFMGPALKDKDNQRFIMDAIIQGLRDAVGRQS